MKPYAALFICLFSLSLSAQQPPAPPKAAAPPKAPGAPAPPGPPGVVVFDPEQGGQPINIRLDVSVIDQTAEGAAQPKSVMVMLVDRAMGLTRAAFQDRSIAVDARPTIVDGRIRVQVTVQSDGTQNYLPPEKVDHTTKWRNSFSLLLENGKPILALETTDAVTKRKMSIEVKATIQK